mgnify:CR=1 FL=1
MSHTNVPPQPAAAPEVSAVSSAAGGDGFAVEEFEFGLCERARSDNGAVRQTLDAAKIEGGFNARILVIDLGRPSIYERSCDRVQR